jgi:hypothetical protein
MYTDILLTKVLNATKHSIKAVLGFCKLCTKRGRGSDADGPITFDEYI